MLDLAQKLCLPALALCLSFSIPQTASAESGVSLANPAAVSCIENGGHYGLKNKSDGVYGVCLMSDGNEHDAWDLLRSQHQSKPKLANPAATFCIENGGSYSTQDGGCTLTDGQKVDGWAYLRGAHADASQVVNPAAAFCIEQGGAYRIVTATDGSQKGLCTQADGTEIDAWTLFREKSK